MNNHENPEQKSTIMLNHAYKFTKGKPILSTAEKERL